MLLSVVPPGTSGEGPPSRGETPELGAQWEQEALQACEPAWGCASGPGGASGGLSPETDSHPAPGWEGAPSFRQGRPPLRPLCLALSHMAGPGVGSEPDSAPSAEIGLLGGRRGAGRGGFGSLGKNRVAGSTGWGVLALPLACELVWGPHPPPVGGRNPCLPGRGQGGERLACRSAEPSTGAAVISTSSGPPAGVKVSWPVVTSATSSPCVSELVGLILSGTFLCARASVSPPPPGSAQP